MARAEYISGEYYNVMKLQITSLYEMQIMLGFFSKISKETLILRCFLSPTMNI